MFLSRAVFLELLPNTYSSVCNRVLILSLCGELQAIARHDRLYNIDNHSHSISA